MIRQLILASSSPRRADILKQIGIEFTVIPSDFDEDSVKIKEPKEFVRTLALKKAESILCEENEQRWILAADTVVVINGEILGKPHTEGESEKYLKLLSGKKHQVYTGVALRDPKSHKVLVECAVTEVLMDHMDAHDIDFYVSTKEPFDKAGAYGIQGIGARFVKEVHGEYFNIVGLPVNLLMHMLNEMGDVNERHTKR